MNKEYEYENSVRVVSGVGALERLPEELKMLGVNNVMLVSGPVLNRLGAVDKVKQSIEKGGIRVRAIYATTPNESSEEAIREIIAIYSFNSCGGIVGVGGGSVLDTVKGVKLLYAAKAQSLMNVAGLDTVGHVDSLPLVLIPTTAGTGSEVTRVAVIADAASERKIEYISSEMAADTAILAPELTLTLPLRATLTSAFDAITHAVEAYSGREKNPLSDAQAKEAIRIICRDIGSCIDNPDDVNLRVNLLEASMLAGAAFGNSMVGAVHAIGHSLGATCGVAHDLAMALLLPAVMEYNISACEKEYAELYYYTVSEEEYLSVDKERRGTECIARFRQLYASLADKAGAAKSLSELGIGKDVFGKIADKAMLDGAILSNIKEMTASDVVKILERAE